MPTTNPLSNASGAGTVLIVDDDAAVRASLQFALEAEGFVVRAFNGSEALLAEPIPSGRVCLVVDYRMPHMDGVRLVESLRAQGRTIPAILITGRANAQLRKLAARAGIHAVLEKPLSGGALVDGIRRILA